ncbi:MAG: protein BatD [Pedobacter sp.]|nr:MAG: protein BatD [Pedobacter sp.]
MRVKFFLIFMFMVCSVSVFAADIKVTASVRSTQVAVGEVFEVSFSVNADMQRFAPPTFNGFQVVGGPNQSSSFSSVNGSTTVSMSLSYDLVATREGEYTIGAATVIVDGKPYKSNALKIKVVKASAAQQGGVQGMQRGGQSAAPSEDLSKRIFIKATPSKTNVFQGEQLSVTYKLYCNIEILDNALDKLPDFNGFWSQEIKMNNQNIEWTSEIINGSRYSVAVLKQIVLFPERFGKLKLDPLAMTFGVRQPTQSNDPIEQFFGGSYKDVKVNVKSTPITINVKPLPEAGKPEGYQGAVGNFSIISTADKTSLKANEAVNYTVKISGSGNLKLLKAPVLNLADDIEKYDPKITDDITETLSGVSGSRAFNYLLIPRHEGNYKLEPQTFSYFNPSSGKYITLTTNGFDLKVAKGIASANVTALGNGQQDVKILDKDIRYIQTKGVEFAKDQSGFYGSGLFYALLFTGPLAFLGAITYRTWYRKNNKDVVKVKGRKASKKASIHLANAQKQLTTGDKKAFYEAIYKGLFGYLSDKFNIEAADLNRDNIAEQLKGRGIAASVIDQLLETIDLCEMARYAPVSGLSDQEIFEKAKRIINDIEHA